MTLVNERFHGLAHDHGKDEAGGAIESAADDENLAIQHEPSRAAERSGVRFRSEMTVGMSAPPIG